VLGQLTSPGGLFSDGKQPDVLIFEEDLAPEQVFRLDQVSAWIDPSWKGRAIVSPQKYTAYKDMPSWLRHHDRIIQHLTDRPGMGWELISDAASMSTLQNAESRGRSPHAHERCSMDGKHVCGLANEMSFQMLINTLIKRVPLDWPAAEKINGALKSADEFSRQRRPDCSLLFKQMTTNTASSSSRNEDGRHINFCLQCPRALVPFSMPRQVHPQCFDYIPTELMKWD
jgi:hypothetical protein